MLPPEGFKVDQFKTLTMRKLEGVRCPDHQQAPRLRFQGTTLRDVTIRLTACCDKLAALANRRIAGR